MLAIQTEPTPLVTDSGGVVRIRIEKIEILTAHPLYMALGTDQVSRQAAYRTLFRQPLDAEALVLR